MITWNLSHQSLRAEENNQGTAGSGNTGTIWKKYKTNKDVTIVGYGDSDENAKKDFYREARDQGLSGPGKSTYIGPSKEGDITNMKPQNPPFITSEAGTEAAPIPIKQANGVWKCERTIPKDTIYLKWFYLY